jgi:hypothetical protein
VYRTRDGGETWELMADGELRVEAVRHLPPILSVQVAQWSG